jgi:hypothetical protein
MQSTERVMEHALAQARYPLWIFTKEEWEERERRWTANEWDIYNSKCDPKELEEWNQDDWNQYAQGYTPYEIEIWRNRWADGEWSDYLYGAIEDRRTHAWRTLERNWYNIHKQQDDIHAGQFGPA